MSWKAAEILWVLISSVQVRMVLTQKEKCRTVPHAIVCVLSHELHLLQEVGERSGSWVPRNRLSIASLESVVWLATVR